ncbi:uncharacterized protein [Eurosta solidaginis]|uniref:uncharacterized protein n=1 Tax=Eurosta solidaginis TaxID=178769 RepID=UPI003531340F
MAPKAQFTLEELTKIALGAPELTTTSVHALHGLVDIILKKVGCQEDTVSLRGIEADILAELLAKSKSNPITFNDKNLTILAPKLHEIVQLEKSVEELQTKLNDHIKTARKFSQLPAMKISFKDLEKFKLQAETQCIPCEKERELVCLLTGDIDFLKKLQRRLIQPMILNLFEFEDEIKMLNDDMNELIDNAIGNLEKLATLEGCLIRVEKLHEEITQLSYKFLGAMEEVQDILDFKLDKIQIPALKRYVAMTFGSLESRIRSIQNTVDCPKPPGIITSGVRCLSCGDRNVCVERGVHTMSLLPDALPHKGGTRLPRTCKCTQGDAIGALGMPVTVLDGANALSEFVRNSMKSTKSTENIGVNQVMIDKCDAICLENFSLLEGTDGKFYRKG